MPEMYQDCLDGHGCSTPITCQLGHRCQLTFEVYGYTRPPPPIREVREGDPPLGRFKLESQIEILDEWSVVDRWWTLDPLRCEFLHVDWLGRALTFFRQAPDKVWRIWQKT